MRVNQLAAALDISADTVRYYTRIGMLAPKKNLNNGYQDYTASDRQRLGFILAARQLGFSVKDIEVILAEANTGRTACPLVRELIEERLKETEKKFAETKVLRSRMQAALKDWQSKPDKAPTGHMICHLIESFPKQSGAQDSE